MGLELITYSISDIGKVITGKTPPASIKSAYSALDGVPFVTPKDMDGRRWIENTERYLTSDGVAAVKRNLVPAMSVAVSCIGSDMGKAILLKKESVTNQQINSIVIDVKRFNPKYIYYVLSTKQQYLKGIAGGSATPILNKTDFGKITFQAPSKYYQDLIVEYLDCLDSKRELNSQINQTLEQMAQALFKSWFVDFDPVVDNALDAGFFDQGLELPDELLRRAEARKAARESGAYLEKGKPLPDATRQLFPAAFEECSDPSLGLGGWVPQGWGTGDLNNVTKVLSGFAFKSREFQDSGFGVIKIKNIGSDKSVDIHDLQRIDSCVAAKAERFHLKDGDLLMAMTGATVGKFGTLVTENKEAYFLNQRVAKFEPLDASSAYLYCTLNREIAEEYVVNAAQGSAQPNISAKSILAMTLAIAPKALREFFNDKVSSSFQQIIQLRKQNMTLTKMRDTLLPKLISGELRLDDIDAELAKVEVA